ncbi:hypothetical protein Q0N65_09665 [Corynebacterium tuberculostearicum]|uniref:hypothetical protein n=1 Tax=Corynebacterium tuberculostearicum TaxID=38304 RepID=UPI0026548FA2|nr:hypothetical protein [Corynebacterium tuberculostearicum]MDN8597526.1 hypothetical protein [Corynebacterium tuberculostearicum]
MKRLPQTLTAAVLTGALAFGGAAVAQAEDATQADQSAPNADAVDTADATTGTAEAAPENTADETADETADAAATNADETDGAEDTTAEDTATNKPVERPDTIEFEGKTWYKHIDGINYVDSPELAKKMGADLEGHRLTNEQLKAAMVYPESEPQAPEKPEFDKKKLAWLALPAALVIGGITWYLSQDGKTYVKDEARKGQEPTAEEKAASEQMLNANKDEVVAQGGKLAEGDAAQAGAPAAGEGTDSVRGMAAETGSNSVAQALAALAVAAMVAAGAFAARRKFFA